MRSSKRNSKWRNWVTILFVVLLLGVLGQAQVSQGSNVMTVTNDGVTGTTIAQLAIVNASGNAVNAGTGNTAVPVFVVASGAGTSGSALLATGGTATCRTDAGGAVIGHFLVTSTTTAGRCHDAGATSPSAVFVIGQAQSTAAANTNTTVVLSAGYIGSAGGGGTIPNTTNVLKGDNAGNALASNIAENADGSDNATKALTMAAPSAPTFNAGGTTTCDFSASNVCGFTMTGNTTLAVTNPHGSGPYLLKVTEDATGNRTITYPAAFQNACQPSGTANVVTNILLVYDGTTNYYEVSCVSTDTPTLISGPERAAPAAPASGGALSFDSTRHTALYQESTDANKHIMPRTGSATDQLACADVTNAVCSGGATTNIDYTKHFEFTFAYRNLGGNVVPYDAAAFGSPSPWGTFSGTPTGGARATDSNFQFFIQMAPTAGGNMAGSEGAFSAKEWYRLTNTFLHVRVEPVTSTNARYTFGFSDCAIATIVAADNPTCNNVYLLASTTTAMQNWQCVVGNGVTSALTDTGVAWAAGTAYELNVALNAGNVVCTVGAVATTVVANLPAASTGSGMYGGYITVAATSGAATTTLRWDRLYMQSDQ